MQQNKSPCSCSLSSPGSDTGEDQPAPPEANLFSFSTAKCLSQHLHLKAFSIPLVGAYLESAVKGKLHHQEPSSLLSSIAAAAVPHRSHHVSSRGPI